MRILGVDPGSSDSAWVNLDGAVLDHGKVPNAVLLANLRLLSVGGCVLALEMVASYGMAVGKEVFETVRWIGRFQEAWEARGGACVLVYRREVKLYLCETAKANDANIRAALLDRYGPGREVAIGTKSKPGPLYGLKGDEWSAFAVALTAAATSRAVSGDRPPLVAPSSSGTLSDRPF